jgi:ribosomal protein S18 acetylase RimI-like enzyme
VITVQAARPADGWAVAQLHSNGITEGFLSSLGTPFLARLYQAMARSSDAILLLAQVDGGVAGFVAGSARPGRFYRWFLRTNAPSAALALLPRALHPRVLVRMMETLRQVRSSGRDDAAAELFAIAVSGSTRRGGIGAALVHRLEQELVQAGAETITVVVGASNAGARAFYERLGFSDAEPIQVHRGEPSVRYRKAIRFATD